MSNVVSFPGKHATSLNLVPSDLHEAFVMVALLIHDWAERTIDVALGRYRYLGDDPYPKEWPIEFEGRARLPSEILTLIANRLPTGPLPAYLQTMFKLWDRDGDPSDPILTYADAIEFLDGDLFNAADEKARSALPTGGALQ